MISQLDNLEYLEILNNHSIKEIPIELSNSKSLKKICLSYNDNLKFIPLDLIKITIDETL